MKQRVVCRDLGTRVASGEVRIAWWGVRIVHKCLLVQQAQKLARKGKRVAHR